MISDSPSECPPILIAGAAAAEIGTRWDVAERMGLTDALIATIRLVVRRRSREMGTHSDAWVTHSDACQAPCGTVHAFHNTLSNMRLRLPVFVQCRKCRMRWAVRFARSEPRSVG